MKTQTAPRQSFSEHASFFNYRISMDTKGPINHPSQHKSYIHVIVDVFSHYVVTVPIKSNNAKTAVKTSLHHWITKYGPPIYLIYLVADRGSEYVNKDMATFVHLWVLDTLHEQHIPLGQMALLKYKIEILAHIFVCFFITPLTIGLFKSTCMLTHNFSTNFRTQCFSLRNSVSHKIQNPTDI